MSVRRFAAYFLAVSAVSTIAFASSFMGQTPAPGAGQSADLDAPAPDQPDQVERLLQAVQSRSRHKHAGKPFQVALAQ